MPGPDSPFTPPKWMIEQEQEQGRLPEEDRISELNSQLERLESGISEQPVNTGRAEKIKKLFDQYRAMKGKRSEDIEALKEQRGDAQLQQTLTSAAEKIAEGIATKGAAQEIDIDMEDMKSRPMERYKQKLKDLEQEYASKGEELDSRFKEQEMVGQARSEEEQARLNKMKNIISLKKAGVDLRSAMRQEEDEEALADPDSPVTKMYRTLAKESHLSPLFEGINPDEYTARELKNMFEQMQGIAQRTGKTDYSMQTMEDPETGETVLAAVNKSDPSDIQFLGKKGYKEQLRKDPLTGEYMSAEELLNRREERARQGQEKEDETLSPDEKVRQTYQELNPKERKRLEDVRREFATETKDTRDSMDKLTGLSEGQLQQAIENPIAAAQLGAQVATIFENGRLTDEDVVRYTRRRGIPEWTADLLVQMKDGTISTDKASDIKKSLDVFRGALRNKLARRATEKARSFARTTKDVKAESVVPIISGEQLREKVKVNIPGKGTGSVYKDTVEELKKRYPELKVIGE